MLKAFFKLPRLNGNIAIEIADREVAADEYALPVSISQLVAVDGSGRRLGLTEQAYQDQGGKVIPRPAEDIDREIAAEKLAEEQAIREVNERVNDLESAKAEAGLDKYTPEQIRKYITEQIDGATTVQEIKAVVKQLLVKMAVYILR